MIRGFSHRAPVSCCHLSRAPGRSPLRTSLSRGNSQEVYQGHGRQKRTSTHDTYGVGVSLLRVLALFFLFVLLSICLSLTHLITHLITHTQTHTHTHTHTHTLPLSFYFPLSLPRSLCMSLALSLSFVLILSLSLYLRIELSI